MRAGLFYMETGHPSRNWQWLLHPDSVGPVPLTPGPCREVRGDGWTLYAERFMPRPGLLVNLTRLRAERPFVLEPSKDPALDQHQVHSTVLVRGRAHLSTPDDRHYDLMPTRALAYTLAGSTARFAIPVGKEVVSFGVTLAGEAIAELLADRAPQALIRLAESRSRQSDMAGWTPTPRVRAVVRTAFAAPYEGPLRELYLEGLALQVLAFQAAALDEQQPASPSRPLSQRERAAVQEARDRLLADMRRPPSLGRLAADAGLTGKRLNEGFRALFGATAFELLREERLEQARLAIAEADDLPLKAIAWRVGYRHVTNFINAFSDRFGEAPGQWRKRARR